MTASTRWRALALGLAVALIYWATPLLLRAPDTSPALYFNQLAWAFLHGRLSVLDPALTHDLVKFQGQWYVPFAPGPALLLLPLVAIFGPTAPLGRPLSAALGGLSAALIYLALRAMRGRGWIEADEPARLWLTGLFAFGTIFWSVASTGSVWFMAHIVTVACLALAVALAVRRAEPVWVGAALAGAILTRPHLALALPFFLVELWLRSHEAGQPRRPSWRAVLALLLPPALAVGGLLWYNWARFANPLDFGYGAANVDPALAQDLARYGQFSLHFLGRNAAIAFLGLPAFSPTFPFFTPNPLGLSLFLTTPALLYLFRRRPRQTWEWAAWGEILVLNVAVLLYYNTGWQQFGYRFSLDYMVFAVLLVAACAGRKVSPLLAGLICLSVLVNLRGVIWWFGGR